MAVSILFFCKNPSPCKLFRDFQQWLSAMAVSNGRQQWLSAMAAVVVYLLPPKTANFEGFGQNGRHHASRLDETVQMVKISAQTELKSGILNFQCIARRFGTTSCRDNFSDPSLLRGGVPVTRGP